jgi:signal transduction histidine kinase
MKSEIRNPQPSRRRALRSQSEISILLVDDTKELNDASARVLKSAGYEVIQAFSGDECLQILQSVRPDLVLLDVVMEGLTGIDVCHKIKSSPDGINYHVILLSGLRISSDEQSVGLEAGADGYIARPVQNREFLARVEAALRIVNAEKNLRIALDRSHKLENELISINATKDLFFSIIAHDLKAPFNTIMGFSDLIIEMGKDIDQVKSDQYMKIIADSALHAYNLMENLLLWAGSQTGKIGFNSENITLYEFVSENISLVAGQAKAKNIIIESSVHKDCFVIGDKNMINTVLRNLMSNAVKFTQHNGRIRISCSVNNSMSEITVADTGIGMPKEKLRKLFMIEHAGSTKGTDNEKGTGLGLILCKDFIEKHGGKIWVESEEGKGSRFIFTLPGIR